MDAQGVHKTLKIRLKVKVKCRKSCFYKTDNAESVTLFNPGYFITYDKNTKLETGYYQETVCHTSGALESVIQA